MEELIKRLASLQTELKVEETKADEASALTDASITDVKDELAELEKERAFDRRQYIQAMQEINATIQETETQIIDVWDGTKKTLKFDAGTLKFRTTQTLKINEETLLLDDLLEHLPLYDVVKYISSFNKTAIEKYLTEHPLSIDVVQLVPKTTVSLTTE